MNESKKLTIIDRANLSKEAQERLLNIDKHPINYDDIPELSDAWLERVANHKKQTKTQISIRLDDDIIEFFKKQSKHYQSHINTILRTYIETVKQ